jgi:hypothetical protein
VLCGTVSKVRTLSIWWAFLVFVPINAVCTGCRSPPTTHLLCLTASLRFLFKRELTRVWSAAQRLLGRDVEIEDLWVPYFCVSANLTTRKVVVVVVVVVVVAYRRPVGSVLLRVGQLDNTQGGGGGVFVCLFTSGNYTLRALIGSPATCARPTCIARGRCGRPREPRPRCRSSCLHQCTR